MRKLMTIGAIVALLVVLLSTAALAKNIRGTNGPDVLKGTNKADTIRALKGADRVFGKDGRDVLRGNRGTDEVRGGDGNDRVYGGLGNDTIYGGLGEDRIYGDSGNDRIFAKDGAKDFIYCGPGKDRVVKDRKDKVKKCEIVNGKGNNPPPPPEDPDRDEDGVDNADDNCPGVANSEQDDLDNDGKGNACDGDIDGDGVNNGPDDFPYDKDKTNAGGLQPGDDKDGDGVNNGTDNCVNEPNPDQTNTDKDFKKFMPGAPSANPPVPATGTPGVVQDGDNLGDACDPDDDNDGAADANDAQKNNPQVK